MYERYYGLKEKPFSLTPDPEFLYINQHFRAAFDSIIYGIKRQEGFTTIVGDVGTGKTTLCWSLLGRLDKSIRTALILNPLLTEEDMLRAILQDFGIRPKRHSHARKTSNEGFPYDPSWMQGLTRKELIDELNSFLLDGADQDIFSILIIDESQNLSLGVLEQLRILSNLETSKRKLLQIIFVGQLEFEEKLRLPQLRQLNQRITIRYELKPLSKRDTIQYIQHRLAVAGGQDSVIFTKGALRCIFSFSRGYPRLINIICDRTLLAGYSDRTRIITRRIVRSAALGLRGEELPARNSFTKSGKVMVPVLALLVLALMAILYFWIMRGSLPSLSFYFEKNLPPSTQASTSNLPVPVPESPVLVAAPSKKPAEGASNQKSAGRTSDNAALERASSAAPEGAGDYLLQVHSLDNEEQANGAISKLKAMGYPAFSIVQGDPNGRKWYVVYAGSYGNLETARREAAALGQQGDMRPIIIRRSAGKSGPASGQDPAGDGRTIPMILSES
jgi:general secretion pathway protein A